MLAPIAYNTLITSTGSETGPPFKSGVLGVVRAGGPVAAGDAARIRLPSSSFRALPAL